MQTLIFNRAASQDIIVKIRYLVHMVDHLWPDRVILVRLDARAAGVLLDRQAFGMSRSRCCSIACILYQLLLVVRFD